MYNMLLHILRHICHFVVGLDIIWLVLVSRETLARAVPLQKTTYNIDMSDADTSTHLAGIVDSLESLGILDESHTNCYSVDTIVKTQEQLNPHTWKINVNVFVKELSAEENSDSQTGENNFGLNIGCSTLMEAMNPDIEGAVNGTGSATNNGTLFIDDEGNATSTVVLTDKEGGLSKTQIMVISTCSTVIGLFFIVALIMRVRNYVKRVRTEQQNRRTAFRSSSLGLRGSQTIDGQSNSSERLHTQDMVAGAAGRKVFTDSKRSNGVTESSYSSCKSLIQNNKPLLVITSASAPSSPTFQNNNPPGTEISELDIHQIKQHENTCNDHDNEGQRQYHKTDKSALTRDSQASDLQRVISTNGFASGLARSREYESQKKQLPDDEMRGEANSQVDKHVGNSDWMPNNENQLQADPKEVVDSWQVGANVTDSSSDESVLNITGMTGLTQSDSSLNSSGNRVYGYGNQCEYHACQCETMDQSVKASHSDHILTSIEINEVDDIVCKYSSLGCTELATTHNVTLSNIADKQCNVDVDNANAFQLINKESGLNNVNNHCIMSEDICPADHENNVTYHGDLDNTKLDSIGTIRRRRLASSLKGRSSTTSHERPYKRKSVTFSIDLDDIQTPDNSKNESGSVDNELEDNVYEDNNETNKANNKRDWFGKHRSNTDGSKEEKSFLLGPEFEGVEPTYV